MDITVREKIVFPLEHRPVLRGYEEYADLPEFEEIYRAVRRSFRQAGLS